MTSDELIDARLYREGRCYLCLNTVPHGDGVRCMVPADGDALGFHYYLCSGCWSHVRKLYSSRDRKHYDRFIPALRAMRPTEAK